MSQITVDLTTLTNYSTLPTGTYTIKVKSVGTGLYTNSNKSTGVSYSKGLYTITTSVTNGTYSGSSSIWDSGTATVTIAASASNILPSTITVNGVTGSSGSTGVTWTYDSSTGVISLSNPTANVTISAACPYTITTSVTNGTYSGDTSILTTATVTITPTTNYELPSTVAVTNATLVSYNSTTGVVSISAPTGAVTITAVCVLITYTITTSVTNGTYSGASTINAGGTATVMITPLTYYELPTSITVTNATYTWDDSTGEVALSAPTGAVTITVVCTQIQLNTPTLMFADNIGTGTDLDERATSMDIFVDGNPFGSVSLV